VGVTGNEPLCEPLPYDDEESVQTVEQWKELIFRLLAS
jgi:hypothetical protein